MKRSEMVEIIAYQLFGGSQYPGHKNEADSLLYVLEKNGMLPPSHEFKMGDTVVRDNCWENEDETK